MEFNFASRLDSFEEGIFATLNDKKNELVKAGRKVYNMSVGTPDFKPAQHIMDAVSEAASKPENYKYALADLPELLDAVSNHYAERYGPRLLPAITSSNRSLSTWLSGSDRQQNEVPGSFPDGYDPNHLFYRHHSYL